MVQKKNDYVKKIEKQMKLWRRRLKAMKKKAEADYAKTADAAHLKFEECKQLYEKLKAASQETWEDLRVSFEKASAEMNVILQATKQTYTEKVEPQIEAWGVQLQELKKEAQSKQKLLSEDYHQMVAEANEKFEQLKVMLPKIKQASGESWKELATGFERAWQDCTAAFERATAKFKNLEEKSDTET